MQVQSFQKGIVLALLSAAIIGVLPFVADAGTETRDATAEVNGDYNRDGVVDAADYTLWRDTLGKSGDALSADGNGDRMIDEADRTLWQTQFGNVSQTEEESGAQAIPEPAAAALALMFLIAAGMWRWFDLRAARNRS